MTGSKSVLNPKLSKLIDQNTKPHSIVRNRSYVSKKVLNATQSPGDKTPSGGNSRGSKGKRKSSASIPHCVLCSGEHRLGLCSWFMTLQPAQPKSRSKERCRVCGRDYHTVLYIDSSSQSRENFADESANQFSQLTKLVLRCILSSVVSR